MGIHYGPTSMALTTVDTSSVGHVVNTWADILNRSGIGFEVMPERIAHIFPLDLASAGSTPVALVAPSIG